MGEKTAGVGHFAIPTAPAVGTTVTSGSANAFTSSPASFGNAPAAIFVTGVTVQLTSTSKPTYTAVKILAAASTVGIYQGVLPSTSGATGTQCGFYIPIYPPIPIANAAAITVATADSVGSLGYAVTLQCINQSNVVDDGVAQTANVTQWNSTNVSSPATAGIPDVNVKNINNVAAATPGASGGILISGSNSGTTTLAALTITGATTHTGNVVLSDGLTISAPSTGNRAGLDISGNGTGAALKLTGGATGQGALIAGGGTSGDGIKVTTTSGHGVNLAPVGTNMHGLLATGGNGGTSDGIKSAAGTGGVDFRAAITGNITGNVSGSVGSVTGAVGSVTGNVGGSVASVTARVTANTDQLAGQTVTAAAGVTFPTSVASPTNITAGTITTATNVTTVNGLAAGVITASSIAADAITDAKVASDVTIASVTGSVGSVTGAVGSVTGNVGGNVVGSVGSVTAAVSVTGDLSATMKASVTTAATAATPTAAAVTAAVTVGTNNDKTGYALSSAGVQAIWDALTSALTTVGSIGKRIVDYLTGDAYARIGSAGAGLTALGDTRIANLDAAVSTRSTYAGGDTTGTTTLLSRLTSGRASNLDNLDAAISTRSTFSGGAVASVTGNVGGNVTGSVGSVVGLTASNLDVAVSSRLASSSYTAPPSAATNASAVRTELGTELGRIDAATSTRLAAADYTAPDNDGIAAIQAKTDNFGFTVPGYADVNLRYVNSVAVNGAGSAESPWGP